MDLEGQGYVQISNRGIFLPTNILYALFLHSS